MRPVSPEDVDAGSQITVWAEPLSIRPNLLARNANMDRNSDARGNRGLEWLDTSCFPPYGAACQVPRMSGIKGNAVP
jgi:hypothetical protein